MKIENFYMGYPINRNINFIIGNSKEENTNLLDIGSENDLWFHIEDISSCHVLCIIPDELKDKKWKKYFIKKGAFFCYKYTNKVKSMKVINIIYTEKKNVEKTNIQGQVHVNNYKIFKGSF